MASKALMGAACAVASVAMFAGAAQAGSSVLLTVDLTVPNEVTITATDGLSAATISGGDITGVYLDDFYGVAGDSLSTSSTGAGDLTNAANPSDGSPALFRGGGGTDTGLNIFSWSSDSTVDFTAGELAFTGSGTWALDPNEYADMLAGNTSGDLFFPADDSGDVAGATFLGTYRVIPTPGALAMLGLAGAGVIRRRR